MQTSPGTTRFFPSIYLPHLPPLVPCSYGTSTCLAALSPTIASYAVPVRQAGGLPPTSFRFRLTTPPPCPWLRLSRYRTDSGLSPVRNVRRRTHNTKALPRLRQGFCVIYSLVSTIKHGSVISRSADPLRSGQDSRSPRRYPRVPVSACRRRLPPRPSSHRSPLPYPSACC